MKRISLKVAVIFLIIGVTLPPSINADEYKRPQLNNSVYSNDEKLISLPVKEYKPDGTICKYFVELTQSQYDEMTERLQIAKDLDERLSIYKDYNMVPEDMTSESLRAGMEEKARRFGLDKKMEKMLENTKKTQTTNWFFNLNVNCQVEIYYMGSIFPAIGTSLIAAHWNWWLGQFILLPCIDLLTFTVGVNGLIDARDGLLSDFRIGEVPGEKGLFFCGITLMIGFVGICYGGWFFITRPYIAEGYARLICAIDPFEFPQNI